MSTFWYQSYPALFEAIIAEADYKTALTLRLCCKDLRQAVDRHQARHLVLTPSGKKGASVRGHIRRVAALRRLGPKSLSQQPVHPAKELLQHVRVLDFRGFFPATCDLTLLKDAFPALSTVRLCTRAGAYTPYVPVGAHTLVVFTSPHGGDCNPEPYMDPRKANVQQLLNSFEDMLDDDPPEKPILPAGVDPRKLPESVRRIVVNMCGEDYAVAEMYHFVLDPPEHVKEIVIVLPRVENDFGFNFPEFVEEDTFAIKIVAMDLAELMIGVPHVRYTLVGLEEAFRTPEEFLATLRKQFDRYQFHGVEYDENLTLCEKSDGGIDFKRFPRDPAKHEAKIADIMARLEIMDFDDYVAEVGEAQATIETVEYEDGTERDIRPRGLLMNDIRRMGPAAQEE